MKTLQTIIIGGGLSGLTLAAVLRNRQPQHRLVVLEKSARTGGVITTRSGGGIIAEPGPHGFLDNCEETLQLLTMTGLDREVLRAPLQQFCRHVYHQKQLKKVPQSPLKLLRAPLISTPAKLRVACEALLPAVDGEPTVGEWGRRRFGRAVLPWLDAAFTGTWAGDIDRLRVDSVMPGVRKLEREYGSVLRGARAQLKKKRQRGRGVTLPAMTSFPGGMQRLVDRLGSELSCDRDLLCNTTVQAITPAETGGPGRWRVEYTGGSLVADNLIVALPVNAALPLLTPLATPPLTEVPEAEIVNIAITFPKETAIPDGFGFLVPEQEQRFILGCLFSSNMFAGRAPEGQQLVEVLVGGRRHPERVALADDELLAKSAADVKEILGINENPCYQERLTVGRIPQPEEGSPALLRWRQQLMQRRAGLHLCGFGWNGAGINDMVKEATHIGEAIIAGTNAAGSPEAKPLYL